MCVKCVWGKGVLLAMPPNYREESCLCHMHGMHLIDRRMVGKEEEGEKVWRFCLHSLGSHSLLPPSMIPLREGAHDTLMAFYAAM